MYQERQYQTDAVSKWWTCIEENPDKNPLIAVPTGAGKTVIMGKFIKRYIDKYPHNKVTVLSHTKEILKQDYKALAHFLPGADIGIVSAGLAQFETGQITVTGIQTAYRRKDLFKFTNLFIVDECHTVGHTAKGMYRDLFKDHPATITGMSATVFRSGHGYLHEGGGIFDVLVYDLTSMENFNDLITSGYLCDLIPVAPETEMDVTGIATSAGDYNVKQLGERFDDDLDVTVAACEELIKYGEHNYKKWLIFAINIKHCNNICAILKHAGIDAQVLHSKMPYDRDKTIDRFKSGDTRALVSVGMVTTGFDAPNIDLIALLRPTKSALLHVQMVGRGLRPHTTKTHCLVLDFAGNTERLGPINDIVVPKNGKKGPSRIMAKKCPVCKTLVHLSKKECPTCGHIFISDTAASIKARASTAELIKRPGNESGSSSWLTVNAISYRRHKKVDKPDSVCVMYSCGLQTVREWICVDHGGFAAQKAINWLKARGYDGPYATDAVLELSETIRKPAQILVNFSDKYPNVTNSTF